MKEAPAIESPSVIGALRAVCTAFEMPPERVVGRSRARRDTRPRQALYWILLNKLGLSETDVARILGRDPTTVRAGELRAAELISTDYGFSARVAKAVAESEAQRYLELGW